MKPNILSLHLMNIKTQNKNNITYNVSRLGEVGDLKAQSLKLVTNFNKYNK